MRTLSAEQMKLVDEIFQREGMTAVMQYLVGHEGLSREDAYHIYSLLEADGMNRGISTTRQSNGHSVFKHYCVFDDEVFYGAEGAIHSKCGTDGYNGKPKLNLHSFKRFFRKLFIKEKIV